MKKKRELEPGWRRRPLADCPVCAGAGSFPMILIGRDGRPARTNLPPGAELAVPCGCVQWPRSRGASPAEFRRELERMRAELDRHARRVMKKAVRQ